MSATTSGVSIEHRTDVLIPVAGASGRGLGFHSGWGAVQRTRPGAISVFDMSGSITRPLCAILQTTSRNHRLHINGRSQRGR